MRRQYHFQRSERGLLAWDVHRLVALAADLPTTTVAVASIRELDEVYWFDAEVQRPTCRKVVEHLRLIREADFAHPILLGEDGRVMDGMHRVAKALLEGRTTLEAKRFPRDPEPDYVGRGPDELPP